MSTRQGFALADGTLSTDYKVGDKFELVTRGAIFKVREIITLVGDANSSAPIFENESGLKSLLRWYWLKAKQFTKSNLKDGMRVYRRGHEDVYYVLDNKLVRFSPLGGYAWVKIADFEEDLTEKYDQEEFDIMRVIDRDGTILFERDEQTKHQREHAELMKKIDELKEQAAKLEEK